ncbi:MAG: hypothetical protein IT323_21885 [Anaerolineae bacterium]|nr:hypothetical protein [Anaerolineae bacterium]
MAYQRQRQPDDYGDLDDYEEKRKRKLKNDELAPDDEVDLASLAAEELDRDEPAPRRTDYRNTPIQTREELRERLAEARRDYRESRSHRRDGGRQGAVIMGAGLIAAGVAFMLAQFGLGFGLFNNWWAFFILAPGAVAAYNAYSDYQTHGRLTNDGKKALGGASFVLLTGVLALTGAWNLWPLYLVLTGVLAVLGIRDESNRRAS